MADQTAPSINVAGLLEGVLAALFGIVAELSPPTLVHPVLGNVETGTQGLWPAPAQTAAASERPATPARLLAPRGLRSLLIGAGPASQAMGKLSMLGLALDPLQEKWSPDGGTIGDVSVQVVDDASAEPGSALTAATSSLSLATSSVNAIWELNPLALDDDTGAALAAVYADLMAAALIGRADTAEFRAAAAGRPLADVVAEGRRYFAETASTWLTMVLALVSLRAAQQADAGAADHTVELEAIVTAYNENTAALPASPFTAYLGTAFLANHPSTASLPDAGDSVDGGHFTDVLRSAVRHTDAASPISEDGGPDHPPDAGTDPGDLGNAILASALRLAEQVQTFTLDPVARWEEDKADCSSFVQRALFGAGIATFDPGPTHLNTWDTKAFASEDVFVTVKAADARPGDLLVQGGYKTINNVVVWKGHCGIFRTVSPTKPDLLEGISMDAHGPTRKGLWGADPPKGYYAFGANLLVRRLRGGGPVVPTVPVTPLSLLRDANQRAHLELIRAIKTEVEASFALLDASLPSTAAYQLFVQVRTNVLQDVQEALDTAALQLGQNAAANADAITAKLEQAQLWLFFLPPYAHLAALIRAAEHDRLVTAVQVECAREADSYARAFSLVGRGTPADLAFARTNAVTQAEHTKQLLQTLQAAIHSGAEATKNAERVEHVLDIPIEFAAGRVLPPWALAAIWAADTSGFYLSQRANIDVVAAHAPTFIGELGWLELNAPATRRLILNPIYLGIARESVHGVSAGDIAFIVGRTLYLLAKKDSPASWADILRAAATATGVVTALHAPKLATLGLGRLTERTRTSMLTAIGGPTDPQQILAELRRQTASSLTQEEALDLLLELTTDPAAGHVKNLAASAVTMGPHIAAIVAAAQGTGATTSATITAGLAVAYPLLPPPP